MRPTRAGIGVSLTAIVCFAIGRTFGLPEMFYLAGMSVVALAFAALFTLTANLDLAINRKATPSRLRVGTPARVDLLLRNQARRRTPVLNVRDHVQDSSGVSLVLAPVRAGRTAEVAYRLPTKQRGALTVGPLEMRIGDPLGLTSTSIGASDQITLVVHAQLIDLGILHASASSDPTAENQPTRSLATGGDEFFALRPYVVGDELRRVHWPASARTGELVVRQEERPRTARVTIVFDQQQRSYSPEGFERAVTVALSALYAGWRGDDALRFLTTASATFADIRSRAELDTIDEQFATLQSTPAASLVHTLDHAMRMGRGGTLIVVTGTRTSDVQATLDMARRRYGRVTTVLCEPTDTTKIDPADLVFDGTTPLQQLWADLGRRNPVGRR